MSHRRFVIEEVSTQQLITNPYNNMKTHVFSKEEAEKHRLEYWGSDFIIYEMTDVKFTAVIK